TSTPRRSYRGQEQRRPWLPCMISTSCRTGAPTSPSKSDPLWIAGYDWQDDPRRMLRIMKDRVFSGLPATIAIEWRARVGVHVEPGKVAARDIHSDPVSALKDQRGRVQLDRQLVCFAGLHELRMRQGVAVASPDDAIGDVELQAGRKILARRIHVDQLGREVRIRRT